MLTVQWKKSEVRQMCLNAISGPLFLCSLLTRYDTNATPILRILYDIRHVYGRVLSEYDHKATLSEEIV